MISTTKEISTDDAAVRTAIVVARSSGLLRSLVGTNVVFTGVQSMKRADMTQLVLLLGGDVQGSVSSTTNILVVRDGGISSAKLDAARRHRVAIMSERNFTEYLDTSEGVFSG